MKTVTNINKGWKFVYSKDGSEQDIDRRTPGTATTDRTEETTTFAAFASISKI